MEEDFSPTTESEENPTNHNGRTDRHSKPVYYESARNGKVLFRSKLEARWAMFFSLINEPWIYEPKTFLLENGMVYVPDFYLENFGWVEVKPTPALLAESFDKIKMFIETNKKQCPNFPKTDFLLLLTPMPNFNDTTMIIKSPTLAYKGSRVGYEILCGHEFRRQKQFKNRIEFEIAIDKFLNMIAQYRFREPAWRAPKFPEVFDLRN